MRLRPTFRLDQQAFRRAIARRIATGRKAAGEVVKQAAKGVLKTTIKYTPPASGGAGGRTGAEAKKAGEMKISRDLGKVFEPVVLKHKREERYPDLRALYLKHRHSRGNRWSIAKALYHVDFRKLQRLYAELIKSVGVLGAAFAAGARALGVALPAWMKRHGEGRGGRIKIRITNTAHPYIEVTAKMPNPRMAADVQRRVDWAVAEETRKMDRQWQHYLKTQQERENRRAA